MRTFETPYAADWFAISLRWAVLLGLIVSLALGGALVPEHAWPLVVAVVWNLMMTVLASLNKRLVDHRQINVAIDVAFAGVFLWTQGGLAGPASWSGLVPILTGAIYFELPGAMAAAGSVSVAAFVMAQLQHSGRSAVGLFWILGMLALGALFGILGTQLIQRLRIKRQAWLDAEESRRQIQTERLRAIYELTSKLTATLSYRRVLDSALDIGYSMLNPNVEETGSDPLVSAVLLFRGGQ